MALLLLLLLLELLCWLSELRVCTTACDDGAKFRGPDRLRIGLIREFSSDDSGGNWLLGGGSCGVGDMLVGDGAGAAAGAAAMMPAEAGGGSCEANSATPGRKFDESDAAVRPSSVCGDGHSCDGDGVLGGESESEPTRSGTAGAGTADVVDDVEPTIPETAERAAW